MMEDKFFDLFGESLKVISSHCPVCHSKYNPVEAKILEESNDLHLIHIKCKNCFNSVLALIIIASSGVSSVGVLTEMTSEEVMRFRHSNRINVDDLIDLHQALKDNSFAEQFILK